MNEIEPESRKKSRRLWPWIVGTAALCMFAVGFSFWSRIQRAQQLAKFASTDNGHPYIDHQHPLWMKRFVEKETFLPWYDKFYGCVVRNAPISDDLFHALCADADLSELALDISNCSPGTIAQLEKQPNLYTIELNGSHQEIPLEWLKSMTKLNVVILNEIPVTPGRWSDLLSFSHLNQLSIRDGKISIVNTSKAFGPDLALSLDRGHLTHAEAAGIIAIPKLKRLTLSYSTSDPEFWDTLSRHPQLEVLTIGSVRSPLPSPITTAELEQIQNISSLTELKLNSTSADRVDTQSDPW